MTVELTKGDVEIQEKVGELIALGLTEQDILRRLEGANFTHEEAVTALRSVYDQWSNVGTELNIGDEEISNWHMYMRRKMLQDALSDAAIPSQRLALSILDSLAQIQGLGVVQPQPVPLQITLEPKPEPEPGVTE